MTRMTLIAALGALTVLGACVEDDDKVDEKPVLVVPPTAGPGTATAVVPGGTATTPAAPDKPVVITPGAGTGAVPPAGGNTPVVVAP